VGAILTQLAFHARMPALSPEASMAEAQKYGMQRLTIELKLTPEQEQTIMAVLDDYGKYYQNIRDEREDVAEHGRQRILGVLNEDQKARFNQIFRTAPAAH
jgi:hypothetical protein